MVVARRTPHTEPLERLLTVEELAAYLGVPVKTIYAWRYRNTGPPGIRIGRHLRFRRSDIDNWLDQLATQDRD